MIVQIASDFLKRQGGMAVRQKQEVQALLNAGHRVTVITYSGDGQRPSMQEKFRNQLHLDTKRSITPPRLYAVTKELFFAVQCYKTLTSLAKKESIDLVISYGSTPCYAAAPFTKRKGIPSVFVIHLLLLARIMTSANPYSWLTTQMYRHANQYAVSNMQYCIGVSSYIRELAIAEGATPGNAFVLHNPVDTQIFHPYGDETKDIDVLFVGRLSPEKGLSILFEAARQFPRETRMLIVGDGPLRKDLERQAQQIQCEIIFQGWVEYKLLPQYIRKAKLQVVPSVMDVCPHIVVEAMACGVPVIGSKTGGIPEMIENGKNGWLVPPNDVEALAKIIKAALVNDKERKAAGQAAYKTAECLSIDKFNDKLVKLYEGMIEG